MNAIIKDYGGMAALGAGVVLALGLVGYVLVKKYGDKFNPANENNLANQAVSGVVKSVTGGAEAGGEDSLGGVFARIREYVSGDDARIRDMLKGSAPAPAVGANGGELLGGAGF